MTLTGDKNSEVTLISNIFIDCYMARANGDYIKVYLYLLRGLSAQCALTIEDIADFLDMTENDIRRALVYWQKAGLLTLSRASGGEINGIHLRDLSSMQTAVTASIAPSAPAAVTPPAAAAPAPAPVIHRAGTADDDMELRQIMKIAERYIERLLTPNDEQLIRDLCEKSNFSSELILYLYEYCAGRGKSDIRYIEKVALSWASEGIRTVDEAKAATVRYSTEYNTVMKAFGMNRLPGTAEQAYIDRWTNVWNFSLELISTACGRALLATGRPDFKYANGILDSWYKQGIFTMNAVDEADRIHSQKTRRTQPAIREAKPLVNQFTAFEQREYSDEEMDALEKRLLNQ